MPIVSKCYSITDHRWECVSIFDGIQLQLLKRKREPYLVIIELHVEMGNASVPLGTTLVYAFKSDVFVPQNHMTISRIKYYPSSFILKVVTLSRITF